MLGASTHDVFPENDNVGTTLGQHTSTFNLLRGLDFFEGDFLMLYETK